MEIAHNRSMNSEKRCDSMEKNKKRMISILAAAFLIPAVTNKIIYCMAKRKKKALPGQTYSWRLGDVYFEKTGSGRPVLLLHDTLPGSSMRQWDHNIAALSKNHTVYTLDFLGFGNSQKPKTTYTAYLYASLINDFIRDVIGGPVKAVASGGASIFLIMAQKQNPNAYKKIMLVCPEGIFAKVAQNRDRDVYKRQEYRY